MEVTCSYHWKLIKIIYRIRWGAKEKDIQINVFRKKQRKTAIKDKKEARPSNQKRKEKK